MKLSALINILTFIILQTSLKSELVARKPQILRIINYFCIVQGVEKIRFYWPLRRNFMEKERSNLSFIVLFIVRILLY